MRIVVIEDNVAVANGVAYRLRDEGHSVQVLNDGNEADAYLRTHSADLLILDVNLPGLDGIEVLQRFRQRGGTSPVLMLTARSETRHRIAGLDAGADDYMAKPFDLGELSARVRALARRVPEADDETLGIGVLSFDATSRMVLSPSGQVTMPRREVAVFEALINAQGRLVSKQQLLDCMYGAGSDSEEPVVEVYISRLRKRLKPFGVAIRVQRGLGYLMTTT